MSSGKLAKIVVGVSVILAGALQPVFAQEGILRVSMNHARVLRLDRRVRQWRHFERLEGANDFLLVWAEDGALFM